MKKLFGFCCLFLLLFSCKTQETEDNVVIKSDKANVISYVIKDRNGVDHTFSINDVNGLITLSLPIDHDVELNKVKPIIVLSKGATISPSSGEVCDFSSTDKVVSYTVTSESGKTKKYTASVKVLGAREALEVESIKVQGKLVENKSVVVDEEYSLIEKSDIEIKFKGEDTPSVFLMEPQVLRLNNKGDTGSVTLSTPKTDRWNAWTETITVKRGGQRYNPSTECKILSFEASGVQGTVDHDAKTVHCVLPPNTENNEVVPIITYSPFALLAPKSGQKQDFSKGPIDYTVTAEDGHTKSVYSITVEKGKSNVAKITSFKIGGVVASINHENGTITALLESTEKLNAIKPEIVVSEYATVNPASKVATDFTNSATTPVEYTVTAEDGHTTKVYKVTITRKKSTEAKIVSFKIGSANASINHENGTITALLESTEKLNAIKPEILVSEYATVNPASNVAIDFTNSATNPVEYTVTAEDGTQDIYSVRVMKQPKDVKIVVCGEQVQIVDGKFKVSIAKTINKIEKTDIQIKYTFDNVTYDTVTVDGYITVEPENQETLVGENGVLELTIRIKPFMDYAGTDIMGIQVSKKN